MTSTGGFQRGPFGEVFIPPLVEGLDPEEVRDWMRKQAGENELAWMEQQYGPDAVLALALTCLQQERLVELVSAEREDTLTPDEMQARRAILDGEIISLRLLGLEDDQPASYAPVLQRLDVNHWRVGVEKEGKVQEIEGSPGSALRQAFQIVAGWKDEEHSLGVG